MVLLRRVLKEHILKVQRGEDPMGVFRDPDHPMLDTNVERDWFAGGFQRQALAEKGTKK